MNENLFPEHFKPVSMKKQIFFLLLSVMLSIPLDWLNADVRLPSVIGSHMVLQQKSNVQLWGWCSPGEKITVTASWDTTHYTAMGTRGADWMLTMATPTAGGPYTITIKGQNTIVLEDVMVGEVWVCSGQSNMEMSAGWGLKPPFNEVPDESNRNIRLFYVSKATSGYPQDNCDGQWTTCTMDDMRRFSAIGYYFAKRLSKELNVPVGVINSNWGGTPAEVWTPRDQVVNNPVLNATAGKYDLTNWWPVDPGVAYNAMIYPITRFAIAGVLWYQGESNVGTYSSYQALLTTMIGSWRSAWHKDFPFYYVQIAPYAGYGQENVCALQREVQTRLMAVPHTGMVVISDLVDNVNDIHPKDKFDVANRLANWALAETYGMKGLAYKYPQFRRMNIDMGKIRLSFDNAQTGLMSKGGDPREFQIAGEDKVFVPAQARIEGNTILVWSKQVKNPVAVRFGFSNASIPNVFNMEGLPVNLFRTDNWDVLTPPVKK